MRGRIPFVCVALLMAWMIPPAAAQNALPTPRYVAPDLMTYGEEAYYHDLAIIETNCTAWADVRALWFDLTERGALIGVISSPQRWLAWVPRDKREAIQSAHVASATGSTGVVSISYTAAEFRATKRGPQLSSVSETAETDEAIVDFLDMVRQPKTAEQLKLIEDRGRELEAIAPTKPELDCVNLHTVPIAPVGGLKGNNTQSGPGDQIARRTKPEGLVVHTSFFLESNPGPWTWNNSIYLTYRSFYLDGLLYWVNLASKYGKSMTHIWINYSPYSSVTQINGEPTVVGEDVFIPILIVRVAPPTFWDLLTGAIPSWSGIEAGTEWGWYYNNKIRDVYGADQSIFGCIAWKPDGDEGIWPHASVLSWNNGDREGVYFAGDTQYWQAELTPYAAPRRNVWAHEIGHLWGAPDEYRNDNCGFTYRGAANLNCQVVQPAFGRPGLQMRGFDGMMKGNYLSGTSIATPVHIGLLPSGSISPVRCFSTQPANIPLDLKNCDDAGNRTFNTTMCVPMEYDYCHKTQVPLTRNISGTTWYFDYWEVKRQSGATTNIDYYANQLSSSAFTSTKANPVTDIKAVYTNSPPDFNSVNTTLTAWHAPGSSSASPPPAIVVRWRSKYDMNDVVTKVEYERTSGNWVELGSPNITVGSAFTVGINQYTGVHIVSVPTAGGGNAAIAANTLYRFRIVGYFNTIRGAASTPVSITTRPAAPPDTVYCNDTNEPNSSGSPKMLTSSGPGMTPYQLKAACPISGWTGEFTWFRPKNDYYRITAINLTGSFPGEKLTMTLRVRPGSNFEPRFAAQRVGSATEQVASSIGEGVYRLSLTTDGEYTIKVEPQISTWISYRLVEPGDGHFGFGEYTLDVERVDNVPGFTLPCPECIKVALIRPFPGFIVSPATLQLFRGGFDRMMSRSFPFFYFPPPGYEFEGWDINPDGLFDDKGKNPTNANIEPNTPLGEYFLRPLIRRIPPDMAELVLVYPDGPTGPIERRVTKPIGTLENAVATPPADWEFMGWGDDTTSTTNPLPVVMWRDKRIVARWRQKPCVEEPMIKWVHRLSVVNARQGQVLLEYGMDAGAGDGLEAGQIDLPPTPPPGTFDIRWINIVGSQGSTTDLRAIQQSFVYQARIQTGAGTTPVNMTWGAPPSPPNATYIMTVQGDPVPIDMRTTFTYSFALEGTYIVKIEVKAKQCPPPPNPPPVIVRTVRVDTKRFPCLELELEVRDRMTMEILPLYNPYLLKINEVLGDGSVIPARITEILQNEETILFRLCTERPGDDSTREIIVVNDNNDPDDQKDTTRIDVKVPTPPGNGKLARFVQQHSGDWELISLPLDIATPDPSVVFPDPLTRLYEFDPAAGAYVSPVLMAFGTGFWLRTTIPATTYSGLERNSFEWNTLPGTGVPFGYGWNLIGAISRSLPVASIVQNPPGGMLSIFSYNPALGYVVPTTVDPGRGFWVRITPGTKLKMEVSSLRGPDASELPYSKRVAELSPAASLRFSTADGKTRTMTVTSSALTAGDIDLLQLPSAPPSLLFDVRSAIGTGYVPFGEQRILVTSEEPVALDIAALTNDGSRFDVLTEDGVLLADEHTLGAVNIPLANGRATLLLKSQSGTSSASRFLLEQNYPNPFSVSGGEGTLLSFTAPATARIRLSVHDLLGRTVRSLLDQQVTAGQMFLRWDGRDDNARQLPGGVYILRLESEAGALTRTITLTK